MTIGGPSQMSLGLPRALRDEILTKVGQGYEVDVNLLWDRTEVSVEVFVPDAITALEVERAMALVEKILTSHCSVDIPMDDGSEL